MRLWHLGLSFSLSFGIGLGVGCSATGNPATSNAGGAGGGGGSGTLSAGPGGGAGPDAGDQDAFGSCAKFSAAAKQAPAAMLFVLDASASMNNANKWGTAQLAVVQAIDKDVFDTMSLGLLVAPSNFTPMPACLCNALGGPGICTVILPMGVSCGVSALAQVPLIAAGMNKSNAATGVRHDIYQFLASAKPLSNNDDGSPIYDALNSGYNTLKSYQIAKRIAVLITDGGFSCTSISARMGDLDANGCQDWEYPDTVNKLINDNRLDPGTPINTFIVGVPGSDSHGEKQGMYDTPQYSMKLALSSYAASGSPDTIDPSCDGKVFSKNGTDPAKPCHIDLSNGAAFNPNALAQAITTIRGKALGCTYDLPTPPPGQVIDPTLVNVSVTANNVTATVPRRSKPSDTCDVDGCWDYNASNQVELIGKTCTDVTGAMDAKVEIYVGCMTVIK